MKETCDEISAIRNDALERFPDPEDADLATNPLSDNAEGQSSALIVWNQSDSCSTSMLPRKDSSFPKAAQVFMDAIKKNRASQKFIRNKLIQIEAKIEENRKLKERVKILKDFQVSCKRRTWESLSQKKDPRVQLILPKGPRDSRDSKVSCLFLYAVPKFSQICFDDYSFFGIFELILYFRFRSSWSEYTLKFHL